MATDIILQDSAGTKVPGKLVPPLVQGWPTKLKLSETFAEIAGTTPPAPTPSWPSGSVLAFGFNTVIDTGGGVFFNSKGSDASQLAISGAKFPGPGKLDAAPYFTAETDRLEYTGPSGAPWEGLDWPAASISLWFKAVSSDGYIFGPSLVPGLGLLLVVNEGGRVTFNVSVGYDNFGTPELYNDGAWHHVVATFDGVAGEMKIYVDGALRATKSSGVPASVPSVGGALWVGGGDNGGGVFPLYGAVDALGLWDRVLTTQEISDLWNGGAGIEP